MGNTWKKEDAMAGVVVCHASTAVRERLVVTSIGVPTLSPVRAAATVDELLAHARRVPPTVVLLDAHIPAPGAGEAIRRLRLTSSDWRSARSPVSTVPADRG